jgi:membrane associated rhomboid family serine protease
VPARASGIKNMGLYDRDYTKADFESGPGHAPHFRVSMPKITPVVKWLLIINVAVFLLTFLIPPLKSFVFRWFSVYPATLGMTLQLWRLVTYQFLHSTTEFSHIFMNMVWLYFIGTMLEPFWGSRKFLTFYLLCGAAGGLLYPLLALVGWLDIGPLVGASGAILGILAAVAILFPTSRVLFLGIFPIRIRTIAIVFLVFAILTLLRPYQVGNAGGEAAHLGGMIAGAVYVVSQSWRDKFKLKLRSGAWRKKMTAQRNLQVELDRILEKVHTSGIHSLTSKEKKILKQATKAEQMRNRF